jgi:site-specific DNA-methyltransferase (adenine-specific)
MATATLKDVKWHPIARIFPMLGEDELEALADDIATYGQREPIIMFEGMVLDGRNRWVACKLKGLTPITKDFNGNSREALALVWSLNATRRDLKPGQKAAANAEREILDSEYAAEIEAMRKSLPKNQHSKKKVPEQIIVPAKKQERATDHKIAEAIGTNRTYVNDARKIHESRPDLHEKVKAGEMTIPQAKTEIKRDEKRRELEVKAVAVKEAFADQPTWTLINQDVLDGLQSVADHHGPARLIFADPPYNIGVDYGPDHDDDLTDAGFVDWCLGWTRQCCDCLTDDGSLWLMINDEYAADFVLNAKDCGLTMRAWIKWYETFGVNCANNFNRTSRHILYFVMDPDQFVFNETAVLRPSDRQTKYNDARAQSSGKIMDDVWQIPRLTGTSRERIPDVPTQLPVELVRRIVEVASEPGDLVVDPFCGSGTTGEACVLTERKFVGIDRSAAFIDIADKRLKGCR